MSLFEWALTGALLFGIMIFCFRSMRRGMRTLDEDRSLYLEQIQNGESRLAEERKKISALEHMNVVYAALEDFLRLEGNPDGHALRREKQKIILETPSGNWTLELIMNERKLRSTNRVIRGRSRWLLSGFGHYEHYSDLAALLAGLNFHFHYSDDIDPEPEHLARRVSAGHPDISKFAATRHQPG